LLLSEIVMAVVLSIVVLKEPVTLFSSIGALFIVIAIALVSVRGKKTNGDKTLFTDDSSSA
jgi:drug/metabolite transporter (DMT)-like permease